MKVETVELRGQHRYSFRSGEWATVVGVALVTPDGLPPRLCYCLRYPDGQADYVPIEPAGEYETRTATA